MAQDLKSALNQFVRFARTLKGDEKSEAQSFLDRFFRALGHDGVIEAGATFEFRVAKKPGSPQLELIKGNGTPWRAKAGKKFAGFKPRCSTLKGDFRYTNDTVFDTFPWPQEPTREQIKAVAEAAVALRALRRETMRTLNYSLRGLYRTLEQRGGNPLRDAHARLDAAVRAAYGIADDVDPLAFLLKLNLACAAKEKAGEKITPPGLPLLAIDHLQFTTEDCIQPPKLSAL